MSTNKTDTINALCLAHRIAQYEAPPPEQYIRIIYKNKTLKIAAHLLPQVSREVINRVDPKQRTEAEIISDVPPDGGWNITPTAATKFKLVNECGTYDNVDFMIKNKGNHHTYVIHPEDGCTHVYKGARKLNVLLRATDDFESPFIATDPYGDETDVLLNDLITFDKNMRLVTRIPMIDGWCFEIKYLNYDVPRPVKRKMTS